MTSTTKKNEGEKIEYVLDTSVLVHEPGSIFKFQEHDVTILSIVLEELDGLKKGQDEKAAIVRDLHRKLDEFGEIMILPPPKLKKANKNQNQNPNQIIEKVSALHNGGVALGEGLGKIEIKTMELKLHPKLKNYYSEIPDHHILSGVLKIRDQAQGKKRVILVTKDINLRQKARSLGIQVEDYRNDQIPVVVQQKPIRNVLSDPLLSKAITLLDQNGEAPLDGETYSGVIDKSILTPNMGIMLKGNGRSNCLVRIDSKVTKMIKVEKQTVSSIIPRNAEQTFLVDAILNSGSALILASGIAGTGNTLLAMAAAIHLVKDRRFHQIVMTTPKVTVSGKDEGALPGNAIEKAKDYMLGLHQNLNFIKSSLNGDFIKEKESPSEDSDNKRKKRQPRRTQNSKKKNNDIIEKIEEKNYVTLLEEQGKIMIQPLSYVRGGTFNNAIIIVDESQNMTPHEAKTIITRAGNNTIVILCGDIQQIDSHYLTDRSNGFSYTRYKMGGEEVVSFIPLLKGERSFLASLAAERM
ncbi:MAG: PhoH family protein [bacterium]